MLALLHQRRCAGENLLDLGIGSGLRGGLCGWHSFATRRLRSHGRRWRRPGTFRRRRRGFCGSWRSRRCGRRRSYWWWRWRWGRSTPRCRRGWRGWRRRLSASGWLLGRERRHGQVLEPAFLVRLRNLVLGEAGKVLLVEQPARLALVDIQPRVAPYEALQERLHATFACGLGRHERSALHASQEVRDVLRNVRQVFEQVDRAV